MKLSALLEQQFDLPSIPKVVALLLNELDRPEIDLKKITQLISTDPALTTRLLQLGNSPSFQLSGRINSVSEALALLDLSQVRTMAQAAATGASLKAVAALRTLLLSLQAQSQELSVSELVQQVLDQSGYVETLEAERTIDESEQLSEKAGNRADRAPATLVSTDSEHDLALLKIETVGLTEAPIGYAGAVRLDQEIITVGFSFGLREVSVTRGRIAAVRTRGVQRVFQVDAAINPGNSGGPAVAGEHVDGVSKLRSFGFIEFADIDDIIEIGRAHV